MPASRHPLAPKGDIPQAVRLIGGRFKRSKLPVPVRPGLRPTPDRVRETLFNWLGQELPGWRVLDAFAGSGALGLEAASRGAERVTLLERDPAIAAGLRETCQRLGALQVSVVAADAVAWMRAAPAGVFDLVCLDPPFGAGLHELAVTAATPLLAAEGLLYVEADRAFSDDDAAPHGLSVWRQGRAGVVHFHLLRRKPADVPTTLNQGQRGVSL